MLQTVVLQRVYILLVYHVLRLDIILMGLLAAWNTFHVALQKLLEEIECSPIAELIKGNYKEFS